MTDYRPRQTSGKTSACNDGDGVINNSRGDSGYSDNTLRGYDPPFGLTFATLRSGCRSSNGDGVVLTLFRLLL
jgi:hypothetical protein